MRLLSPNIEAQANVDFRELFRKRWRLHIITSAKDSHKIARNVKSSPCNSASNGGAERTVCSIKEFLRTENIQKVT